LPLAASIAAGPPPERVALTGARIITMAGEPLEQGTVLIEHGRIVAVGPDVEVPYDARVFDLSGKVVFPGMINVHTAGGLDVTNEPRPVVPQLNVYDAIDPSQLFFEDALRLGITGIHVIPGNNTVIGGLGRVVHPIGMTVAEMTITEGEFLKLSISPRSGLDHMSQMATLRETFLDLDDYLAKLAENRYEEKLAEDKKQIDVGPAEARRRGRDLIRAEDIDDEHRNMLRLIGGKVHVADEDGPRLFEPLGAFIYCEEAMDVGPAVRLAKEHDFLSRTVLVLDGECYKAVGELRRAARPVVLPPELIYRETDPLTGEVRETFVPKVIHDAGLEYALIPGPDTSYAERMLTYQAACCVRYGIPREAALKAITVTPAKMLGLEGRLGAIAPGFDAYLVVFSGDPLDFNSVVEKVFIDGIPAYDRDKDVRLKRLLTPGPAKTTEEKPE
jgi:imidazolonepropionase-like amidohydrolase